MEYEAREKGKAFWTYVFKVKRISKFILCHSSVLGSLKI